MVSQVPSSLQQSFVERGKRSSRQFKAYGGFHSHRGTPIHHPFLDGIFSIDQWAGTWWFSCKPNCRPTTNSQYIPMNSFYNCHFSKVGSIVKLADIAIESTLCPYIPITSPCSLSSSHQFLHCQLRPFFRRRRRRAQRRPKHSGPRRKPWENNRRKQPEK